MDKFYITTAIPYVNGKPHLGHALEYFQADTIRNFHKLIGKKTLLLSGADENALKNVQTAEKEGIPVMDFLNKNSMIFEQSYEKLGVKLDIFERGSDEAHHFPGVQKLWELCEKNGDIYKKRYKGLYCVGCESFKMEKELVDGKCPIHQKAPETVEEENYFFKLSRYGETLLELIENNKLKIIPEKRKNEVIAFIKRGLEDFSISRNRERAKGVGVPVPGSPDQVVYVWFDALAIYITGIGFGIDEEMFKKWWPADLHVIGKDINRFHTIYWPAMLLSAGLPTPKAILIHGFVETGGQKMSKSLGNVIDPFKIANEYGLEAFRYFMLSQIPTAGDGDFTVERFKEVYNADLANGIGNLVARVAKLSEKLDFHSEKMIVRFYPEVERLIDEYNLDQALIFLWEKLRKIDKKINEDEPWNLTEDKLKTFLDEVVLNIKEISYNLRVFLPETAEKIEKQFTGKIKSGKPLFPRI